METFGSYIKGFFVKCMENASSAKMWMFLLPFVISSAFMGLFMWDCLAMAKLTMYKVGVTQDEMRIINEQLSHVGNIFISWCTFNVSLASVIIAVREIFKVKKLNALTINKGPMTNTTAEKIANIKN